MSRDQPPKIFKKGKSATFQIDGQTYTIGMNDVISEASIWFSIVSEFSTVRLHREKKREQELFRWPSQCIDYKLNLILFFGVQRSSIVISAV